MSLPEVNVAPPPAASSLSEEEQDRVSTEETTVVEVVAAIRTQISYGAVRLRDESAKARDLTARIVRARRDSDKQLLASDEAVSHKLVDAKADEINTLEKLRDNPYFGRIVLDEQTPGGTKEIEYKLGLAANSDLRIIDWRKAPIAKLYYEYQEGEEYCEEILGRERNGTVRLRNKVDIDEGQLKRLSCRLGTFVRQGDGWIKAGSGGTSASRLHYGQLPSVTSLISPEQFQTITEDADAAVLIQGIAGSGKTTVALHRLAWLLHEDNSDLKAGEVAIIVLSKALRKYIEASLLMLQITGVNVLTYNAWTQFTLKKCLPEQFLEDGKPRRNSSPLPPGMLRTKRSMAVLLGLEEFCKALRLRILQVLDGTIAWNTLPKTVRSTYDAHKDRPIPIARLLSELEGSLQEARSAASGEAAVAAIKAAEALVAQGKTRVSDLPRHVLQVLRAADAVMRYDDTKLLDRQLLNNAYTTTESNFALGLLDETDDALLLRAYQLLIGPAYTARGQRTLLRHMLVDEVQDFGATELATVIASVEERSQLTLVGDSGQQVRESEVFPGWEKLRSRWSLGNEMARYTSLTVAHRSTASIMRLADYVRGEQRSTGGRPGKAPLWYSCRSEQRGVTEALGWLERVSSKFTGSLIAVICSSSHESGYVHSLLEPTFGNAVRCGADDDFSFDAGIVVADVQQIKGLEFPHVLIWNPSVRSYPSSQRARNQLYVAITRCEEHLAIVSWGPVSPLLPNPDSQYVRGMFPEEDDPPEELTTDLHR